MVKHNENMLLLMIALGSSFGILTSLFPSSKGLCITGCYLQPPDLTMEKYMLPLCQSSYTAYLLFTLTIGLLLITSSHQNLIPQIKEELSKTQWLCSCYVNCEDLSLSLNSTLVAQLVKNPPAMQETWVWSLGWEDPLKKGKTTHFSILAWRIPWTVWSMGSRRVRHDWATFTFTLHSIMWLCDLGQTVDLFGLPPSYLWNGMKIFASLMSKSWWVGRYWANVQMYPKGVSSVVSDSLQPRGL